MGVEGVGVGVGGASAAAYVPPDWRGAPKKKKRETAANETRRKAAGGQWRNICEAMTLWKGSAVGPPVCGAASCTTPARTCT